MIALVQSIGRAELRLRAILALTLAYGLLGTLMGITSHRSGPYPVLTDAVANLDYLGGLLLATGGLIAVRAIEFGVGRELLLCGISARRRSTACAAVAVGCALAIWVAGNALTALAMLALLAARPTAMTLVSGSQSGIEAIATGAALTSGIALLGSALGVRCRSRAAVLVVVGSLAAAPLVLLLFGSFPPALWLRSLLPTAQGRGLVEAYEGARGTAAARFGPPLLYLVGATCLLLVNRPPGLRRASKQTASHAVAHHRPPRHAWISVVLSVTALAATATAFGYVAPEHTAHAIPWWLRGDWLADQARKTTSAPVARAYVAAVLRRDAHAQQRLSATDAEPLDPVMAAGMRSSAPTRGVRFVYNERVPSGTVVVTLGPPRHQREVTVCSRRTPLGWRVTSLSSAGLC